MQLQSDRLLLKEISWEDMETIHRLYCCPEVDEYNTLGIPQTMEETKAIVRRMIDAQRSTDRRSFHWKIVKRETGEFLGMAGITLSADRFRSGEISYELFPEQWGNGYATETAKTLVTYGFRFFHLHRIEAGVATENMRSVRVLEKAGMKWEGVRRKILPVRGEWKDNYIYAILEDDIREY